MKKNNKLTPQIHKEIVSLAQQLPVMYRTTKDGKALMPVQTKVVKGSEIESGKLSNGDDVNPDKLYISKNRQPLTVNHEVEMIDLYQKKGMTAVNNYAGMVVMMAKQAEESQKKQELEVTNNDKNQ